MFLSRLAGTLALLVGASGCDSTEPQPPDTSACADWWRGGTWGSRVAVTDFTQPCRPVDQVCAAEPESHGWTMLAQGEPGVMSMSGRYGLALGLDACGQPLRVRTEPAVSGPNAGQNSAAVFVERSDGTAWEPVGPQPALTVFGKDVAVALALDPTGRPVVAASDGTGAAGVVAHNGPGAYSVVRMEQPLQPDNGTPVWSPEALVLTVDAGGHPIAAAHNSYYRPRMGQPGDSAHYYNVYRYEGSGPLTNEAPAGSDIRTFRLDARGTAWLFKAGQLLRRPPGASAWTPVGPLLPEGRVEDLQLAPDGRPVVLAFVGAAEGGGRFDVLELVDEAAWTPRTSPLIGLTRPLLAGARLRLAASTGAPVVAWGEYRAAEYGVRVLGWDGAGWVAFGAQPEPQQGSSGVAAVQLELDASGNPTVAWVTTPASRVFVARYRP